MRLLDTKTLKLHSFLSNSRGHIPDYAILSHRWDNKEVSFQNLESGRGKSTEGYIKIEACCAQARPDGWEYVWVDSCCIDKTSSAELSEAINSMYQWYKNAQVCYAYLRDVDTQGDIAGLDGVGSQSGIDSGSDIGYSGDSRKQFKNSTWFMRGWTLQELLAPSRVVFFDCNWIDIGTKSSLEEVISDITGIEDFLFYESACVAQKMSWAAGRKTTRVEDEAYCLMGLFGVNMPLLYGEGNNAFMRLQQEIIKTSDDESIFAWSSRTGRGGLLAESPRAFLSSGGVRPMPTVSINTIFYEERPPFTMTNRGLHISLFLIP
ncbi:HET-domain-containing protein, partial [Acephala macrosclerotiorum]